MLLEVKARDAYFVNAHSIKELGRVERAFSLRGQGITGDDYFDFRREGIRADFDAEELTGPLMAEHPASLPARCENQNHLHAALGNPSTVSPAPDLVSLRVPQAC